MRPTPEEVRQLARAAADDAEGTGLPLIDRIEAAIRAGLAMAADEPAPESREEVLHRRRMHDARARIAMLDASGERVGQWRGR